MGEKRGIIALVIVLTLVLSFTITYAEIVGNQTTIDPNILNLTNSTLIEPITDITPPLILNTSPQPSYRTNNSSINFSWTCIDESNKISCNITVNVSIRIR